MTAVQGAPALFPLFRSELQAQILLRLLVGETRESITDLAEALHQDRSNTSREVMRLEEAGLVNSEHIGRTKLVTANQTSPAYEPLRELLTRIFGPHVVLAELLSEVTGIRHAAIFGSWAARVHGEQGPPPADIDLLIVGRPNRDAVYEATRRATERLGREINTVIVSSERWQTSTDPFLVELRNRPMVPLNIQREESEK